MTQNGMARRLKGFGIRTKDVGPKHDRVKGYERESFADAFSRYISGISGIPSAHPRTTNEINELDKKPSAHQTNGCADGNQPNPLTLNEVRGCADGKVEKGKEGETGENDDLGVLI
jgi:Protein of unknown function (DUF3631)